MIRLKELFTFNSPYIAAASGLAVINDTFYVISDDELSLVKWRGGKGESIRIFEGDLPEEHKARKKIKPDFESLVVLPDQSILCLPSGSKENRTRGARVYPGGKVEEHSFKNLYKGLPFKELNIEGAVTYEDKIRLFQRGNGKHHENAIIDLKVSDLLQDKGNVEIKHIELGKLKGIPLSFTDASLSQGLFWFLAVAENSESTYLDGEFVGAVLGAMDLEGNVHFQEEIEIPHKPEGLVVRGKDIFIVTDSDDRTKPSRLYSGVLD